MKYIVIVTAVVFIALFAACNQTDDVQPLQVRLDDMQKQLDSTYRPGLGEFMIGIQLHHAKLWFAGKNGNWPLANFEIQEIEEALQNIHRYNYDRPEVKAIGMLDLPLDSVNNAIQQQSIPLFKKGYVLLTNTCNNCHTATNHGFNVITIPVAPPVSDQEFKPDNNRINMIRTF
jgi:hypothetical protein